MGQSHDRHRDGRGRPAPIPDGHRPGLRTRGDRPERTPLALCAARCLPDVVRRLACPDERSAHPGGGPRDASWSSRFAEQAAELAVLLQPARSTTSAPLRCWEYPPNPWSTSWPRPLPSKSHPPPHGRRPRYQSGARHTRRAQRPRHASQRGSLGNPPFEEGRRTRVPLPTRTRPRRPAHTERAGRSAPSTYTVSARRPLGRPKDAENGRHHMQTARERRCTTSPPPRASTVCFAVSPPGLTTPTRAETGGLGHLADGTRPRLTKPGGHEPESRGFSAAPRP